MTDDRSLERTARSWIEAGPTRAPEHAVNAALERVNRTTQERGIRVPWRFPAMTTPARLAAAALVGVVAIGGVFLLIRPSPSAPGTQPTPEPTASPSASPSPSLDAASALAAYREARNAICEAAIAEAIPNIELTDPARLYDPAMPGPDRALAVAAVTAIADRADRVADELEGLDAPAQLAEEHLANVTRYRDSAALIRHESELLAAAKPTDARAVDESLGTLSGLLEAYETKYALAACP